MMISWNIELIFIKNDKKKVWHNKLYKKESFQQDLEFSSLGKYVATLHEQILDEVG